VLVELLAEHPPSGLQHHVMGMLHKCSNACDQDWYPVLAAQNV
jgi:hypothetical protein